MKTRKWKEKIVGTEEANKRMEEVDNINRIYEMRKQRAEQGWEEEERGREEEKQ